YGRAVIAIGSSHPVFHSSSCDYDKTFVRLLLPQPYPKTEVQDSDHYCHPTPTAACRPSGDETHERFIGGAPWTLSQKLYLAVSVYFVWQESNQRILTNLKRNNDQLVLEIKNVVMARIAWKANQMGKVAISHGVTAGVREGFDLVSTVVTTIIRKKD
ncbi:Protein phosphatase 2C, partial [Cynara cardunculus var. scolymus]